MPTVLQRLRLALWRWRQPALAPLEWHRSNKLVRRHFLKQLETPEGAVAFDGEFEKALISRRTEKAATLNKLMLFGITLTGFMGLWFVVDNLQFSLLGMTVQRTDQLVELVRVAAAANGLWAAIIGVELRIGQYVLDVLSERRAAGEAFRYVRLRHATLPGEGLLELAPNPGDHRYPLPVLVGTVKAWHAITLLATATFIVTTFVVQILVLWSMIAHPAIGPVASRVLAGVALLFDLSSLGMVYLAYGPLPLRNFKDTNETASILKEQGYDAWWAEMQTRIAARVKGTGRC